MRVNPHLKYLEENTVDVDYLIGKRLRKCRIDNGLTQQELAKKVSVSIQQLQKYEKAVNRISSSRLYDFALALNVPIDYFYIDSTNNIDYVAENTENDIYQADITEDNLLEQQEIREVINTFSKIKNPGVRKNITEFLKNLSFNLPK